ncbi:MAG TPA: hypothetical protein VFQ45_16975 [Longimicrobium sp.]|nr:hypothetical protein [Longimicrobium sp.]
MPAIRTTHPPIHAAAALLLLAAAMGACARTGPPAPRPGQVAIFREITVGTGQRIALGEPVRADARRLMVPLGDGRYRMRAGTFADAEEITVALSDERRVQSLHFVYAAGTSYRGTVAGYVEELGPAASAHGTAADSVEVTRWEDWRTILEVTRRGATVESALHDRTGLASSRLSRAGAPARSPRAR